MPFTGRDGRSYQLWRLAKDDIRRRATFQNLSKQLLEPVPSEAVVRNAFSAAQASLPMLIALETPTLRALELRSLREAVSSGKGVPIDPWVCDEAVGVREVACCTSKRQPLATLRLALRLREEVALTPTFLSALAGTQLSLLNLTGTEGNGPAEKTPLECASNRAPAGAQRSPVLTLCLGIADGADGMTPSTAPSLPPGHWAAALAAEEMTLSSAVERLQEVVAGACSRLMCAEGVSNGVDIPGNSASIGKHSSLQDALQQGQGERLASCCRRHPCRHAVREMLD